MPMDSDFVREKSLMAFSSSFEVVCCDRFIGSKLKNGSPKSLERSRGTRMARERAIAYHAIIQSLFETHRGFYAEWLLVREKVFCSTL